MMQTMNIRNDQVRTATRAVHKLLGEYFDKCQSLTLRMEKFIAYDNEQGSSHGRKKVDEVKAMCVAATKTGAMRQPTECFSSIRGAREFALELQSRLLVNHSGGVIENTSLQLHRFFGVPMIPGSSLKGVARHYALEQLRQAGNVKDKIELLSKIALTFGWADSDWKDKKDQLSDYQIASGRSSWLEVKTKTSQNLCLALRLTIPEEWSSTPWKALGNFAGLVSFLPAIAECQHEKGILEVDLINNHHTNYYKSDDMTAIALDVENPIPNFFPAVRAGLLFVFTLAPVMERPLLNLDENMNFAEQCLQKGLSMFGVGAKTNAGYGWFEKSDATKAWHDKKEEKRKKDADDTGKTPEQREEDAYLLTLSADKLGELKGKIGKIEELPENEQKIICRLFAGEFCKDWKKDCLDADKAKGPNDKKHGKAFRRVTKLRQIASKVGVEMP